ncbi:P2X purinoceptor 7-like [Gigantopelta aegis]|uniref:P2X purinoceptor 7-like n=1 Tax=Gigantopelta aegis TaxID=1735272 RepID=UPI001B8890DE|nr:P2X purinoceptor 7-like [Gigantopelta aegis]
MPNDEVRNLCLQLAEREPGMVFDLCEASASPSPYRYHPPPGQTSPSWCRCGNCREMPTEIERKCCDNLPRNCISQQPEMDILVLEEQGLRLAYTYRNDILGLHNLMLEDYNTNQR